MPDPTPAVPDSRRERKKQEARRRIYDAAFALFVEKGYDATTVEEIAERADVAKGTVFNYFPRKTSLLAALAEHWTASLLEELGPVAAWRGTTREKLSRVFLSLADLGAQNPALARLAFFESLRFIHRQVREQRPQEGPVGAFHAITVTLLQQGQTAGEVRPGVAIEHAASLIESAFHRSLGDWLLAGASRGGLHRELAAKLDIVFNGIAQARSMRVRTAARVKGGSPS